MNSNDSNSASRRSWFWLRVIELRLRFFLLIALIGAVFSAWPWMVHTWSRITAGRLNDLDTSVSGDSEFFCPMDPGVISPWPAICPICNMDLVRRPKADALLLPSGVVSRMQLTPYRISLAGVKTAAVQPLESDGETQDAAGSSETVKAAHFEVPVSSIVYWDRQSLVYAETMANMFDAVPVTILSRRGDQYVIEAPWTAPPRVAAIGTFLLDAETRLNPSLSTQYFGAAQNALAAESPPTILQRATTSSQAPAPRISNWWRRSRCVRLPRPI